MRTIGDLVRWAGRASGVRFLAQRRAACGAAVVTMALALGANTLVFAIAKAFMMARFALPEPGRVFVIAPVRELPGRGEVVFAEAYANYGRLREAQRSFADIAVMSQGVASWDTGEEARPLRSARVSSSFFTTARVSPARGRAFRPEEEGPGAARVVIISDALWRGGFGGDAAAIGRTMRIDGSPHTVVGVMPPGFSHPLPTDVWLPFDLPSAAAWTAVTGARSLAVYGRLKDGVPERAAAAEMAELTRRSIEATTDNRDYRYTLRSIREYVAPGTGRVLLFVQLGAVLLVLLAVANLASLLIAWGFDRRREIAVRLVLGAGGPRITLMLVMQSLIVVGLGGLAGLAITVVATPFVRRLNVSPELAIYFAELRVDGLVLGITTLAIGVAGILAGSLPARLAGRTDPGEALRDGGRGASLSPSALRWQKAMVVAQATLSVVIVSVAVLIGISFHNLGRVAPGFRADGLVVSRIQLSGERYANQAGRADFGARLLENLAREPGLEAWGFTSTLPAGDPGWGGRFFVDPAGATDGDPMLLHIRRVSARYPNAMGIPLLRGRAFEARDDSASTPVALISAALAKRLWPGEDPVGRRIHRVVTSGPPVPLEVIGVVGDVRDGGLNAPAGETVYVHWAQTSVASMSIIASGRGGTDGVLAAIRRALRATDPAIAANNTATLASLLSQANALPRLQTILLGLFALVAVAMVLLGGYGVMTQLVLSRKREFALRLLFGARPAGIAATVLGQAARLSVGGSVAGLAVVWLSSSLLEPLVFGVPPRSGVVLAGVASGILLLAAAAAVPPAIRAAAVDIREGAGGS